VEVIRLNNVKIEEMAVSTVNELFLNHSNNISSHIKTDDKGISFDGNLNVYKSDQFTKESYLNSIPIQVKGSLVNHFSGQTIKYYEFDKNEWTVYGEPDTTIVVSRPATVELTCASIVNRIPDVINAESGFVPTCDMDELYYRTKELNTYLK